MDNKFENQNGGWSYWANLVVNTLTNLEKQIGETAEDIQAVQEKLSEDIQKNRLELSDLKGVVGQLQTLLEGLKENVSQTRKACEEMNLTERRQGEDIAALKVKASIWGGISGAIISLGMLLIQLLTKK